MIWFEWKKILNGRVLLYDILLKTNLCLCGRCQYRPDITGKAEGRIYGKR